MESYSSYKDSGVEWIGDIPKYWYLNKVGHNTYVKGRIGWKGLKSDDFIDEGPYLITGTDFQSDGSINWEKMYHVDQKRYDEDPFIQLKDNDVLITKDGTIGKVVYVGNLRGETCLNSGIFLTRPTNEEYISKYFFWVLKSNVFKIFVDYNSDGSTIQHLYQNVFINFKFPIPPIPEQTQIVSFLDTKTQKIDELIKKTEQKIKLLKEKRTSLINHCVTKGLNPNVEMKDSGVEWIGEIPIHYDIVRLKFLCSVKTGSRDTQDKVEDGDYPFYVRSPNIERINSYSFDGESVLTVGDGVGTGKVFHYVNGKFEFHQRVYKFSDFKRITGKFFYWFMKHHFIFVTEDQNSKSTVDSLRRPLINGFQFVIPSIEEQTQIVEYLDEHTKKIDSTIEKETQRTELLKEYRQSLISEVVTGKIDVRDYNG
jgi:type I restriction enzyme, S subunit